jgi:hypothetical protein
MASDALKILVNQPGLLNNLIIPLPIPLFMPIKAKDYFCTQYEYVQYRKENIDCR